MMPVPADLPGFFKALADKTRLHLVVLLAQQEPEHTMCVGRLARELGVTDSSVSQHLRVLKGLGLVQGERRGYRVHYHLKQGRFSDYWERARQQLGTELVPYSTRTDPYISQIRNTVRLTGRQAIPSELDHPESTDKETEEMCKRQNCGCQHPEEHVAHGDCSAEQIQECHGDEETHTCGCGEGKNVAPGDCSPDQIQECHGDAETHPCECGKAQDK